MKRKLLSILFLLILLFIFYPSKPLAQSLNEGFNSSTFPPSGWTQVSGLWSRYNVSGFCIGTGSAQAHFYLIASGSYALTTPVFTAAGAGDSLIFQDAYASYSGENDQLQVMYSVNGGGTFSLLVMLNGGTSGELVTAPPTTSEFVPLCNQWKYQRRLLPQGTNRLRFIGISAYGNNLYLDSIYIKNAPQIGPLCEGFNPIAFPPPGWNFVYTGNNYWSRQPFSGFGMGSGCAEYNIWNATAGTIQSLITISFTPSVLGDSLDFDLAYAPYPVSQPYNQDSLYLLASTNNGASYMSISRLGPVEMQTTASQTTEFIPSQGQWGRRQYWLPAGVNKIQFTGYSAFGNNLYIDSICVTGHLVGVVNNNNSVPDEYSLLQNYPNPFNPSTRIDFSLPKTSFTKLIIYDVLGKEVAELMDRNLPAGKYSVKWDASRFSSGVFFYTLKAGGYTETKSMVLIK